MSKVCKKCNINKELTNYHKKRNSVRSVCKTCTNRPARINPYLQMNIETRIILVADIMRGKSLKKACDDNNLTYSTISRWKRKGYF